MAQVQTLKQASITVDGVAIPGNVTNITPPKITVKSEDHRGGGMDTSIPIDMGIEPLEAGFTLTGINQNVQAFIGQLADNFNAIIYAAWLDAVSGAVVQETMTLRGKLTEMDKGDYKPGEKQETKYTAKLTYYKSEINGGIVHEIDALNTIRIVNGVDQMQAVRAALGI